MDRFEGKLIVDDTSNKSMPDRFLGSAISMVMARGLSPGTKGLGEVEMSKIFNDGGAYRRFLRLAVASSVTIRGEGRAIITMNIIDRFHPMVQRTCFNPHLLNNTEILRRTHASRHRNLLCSQIPIPDCTRKTSRV